MALGTVRRLYCFLPSYKHAGRASSVKIYCVYAPELQKSLAHLFGSEPFYSLCHSAAFAH